VLLLASITSHVNELITGGIGLFFIGAAFLASIASRKPKKKRSKK